MRISRPSRHSRKFRTNKDYSTKLLSTSALLFLAVAPLAPTADAVVRTWIGGNTTWNDNAGAADWSGSDEPDSNDDALFDAANNVVLGTNQTAILSLTLTGGPDLDTNGFDLDVDGLISVSTSNTSLTISDATSLVTAYNVTTATSGRITLDNGVLTVNDTTGGIGIFTNGGSLTGRGTLNLSDVTPAAATTLFDNTGTLTASAVGLIIIGNPPAGTLTINITDADGRIDLDGGPGNGTVNVNQNQTLDINGSLADQFNGSINLFQNSTLDISTAWSIGTGALITADNGAIDNPNPFPDIPAGISHIAGGALTQSGGTINVVDPDGTLQFDAPFTMNGGDLVNNGNVIFNANATINAGANFTNPVATSSLTVNAGVTVTVNQLDFNADGTGSPTNVITVNSGGTLALNIGTGSDDSLTGAVVLNGGTITVDDAVDADWSVNGSVTTGNATGLSTLAGDLLLLSSPAVSVAAGSTLVIDTSSVTFAGGSYTGAGTLRIDNNATYSSNTTLNVASLDWDGGPLGNTHTINAGITLTINSTLTDAMDDNVTVNGNGGALNVNGAVSWTMDGNLTTNPGAAGTATIGGTSRMVNTGTFTVTGNTDITAPVTFGATNTTTIAAAATLDVTGNTIFDGGTVTGTGTYNPALTNSVAGNSTISVTNFNFDRTGSAAWTIDAGNTLTVNVGDYDTAATKLFQGTITLNSGNISVTTGDPEFIANGNINLNNTTGAIPVWSGEGIDFGDDAGTLDSNLNVGGAGDSVISAQVDFNSDADVTVAAGATLVLTNTTLFLPVNAAENGRFDGAGTFVLEGAALFSEATTLDFVGGAVDLDGRGADDTGDTIFVSAPLVINAATLNSFGKTNGVGGPNTLSVNNDVNTGTFAVNLDNPASEWTLNSQGVINLVNDAAAATLLSGSPLNVNGALNITGDVRSTARLDIGSTAVVTANTAAQPFRLAGGTLADPNTITGGVINGPGLLGADTGRALVGRGTINADVDFDGASELRATGGTLTVNSLLIDVGTVGTADASGTLALSNPQTLLAGMTMELLGGNVTGAALTNQALIRGNGTIANNTTNAATGVIRPTGGTLRFTGVNGANAGTIDLNSNTAEFSNALNNAATGLIRGPGTLRANGNLTNNGTVRAIGATNFFGVITNNAGSLLDVDPGASATFDNNVTVQNGANATMGAGSTNRFFAALTVSGTVVQDLNVAATSVVTLTINATGTFDCANNRLIVDYAGASPINTIRQYILTGRLFSSVAAADPDNTLTIGYAEASALGVGSWSGLAVDATAVLTRLTYFGDANMNGEVDPDDFTLIDRGFALGLTGWVNGDFNHSGTITPADYQLIDRVFLEQGAPLAAAQSLLAQRATQFGPQYVSSLLASIPEPSSLFAACGLALPLLSRRRPRR